MRRSASATGRGRRGLARGPAPGGAAAPGGARRAGEERVHLVDQRLRLEGLRDVAVGAGARGALLVERLEGAGQEQHRNVSRGRVGLDRLADLVAVLARHHDVGEDHVRPRLARARDRVVAVVHGEEHDVLVREADADDLLDRHAVVGKEQGLGHGSPLRGRGGSGRASGAPAPSVRIRPYYRLQARAD